MRREKLEGCERFDPLVRGAGCRPACFGPFDPAGASELETTDGR